MRRTPYGRYLSVPRTPNRTYLIGRRIAHRTPLLPLTKMGITLRSGIGFLRNWYRWKDNSIIYNLIGLEMKIFMYIKRYSRLKLTLVESNVKLWINQLVLAQPGSRSLL